MEDPFSGNSCVGPADTSTVDYESMLNHILDVTRGSMHAPDGKYEVDNRNTNSHEYQGVVKPLLLKRVVPDL